jgi:hypothetical protein
MTKHAIFTIRYSLLSVDNQTNWRIGRNSSFDKYKKVLLNSERLKLRRNTFSKITIPSLLSVINHNKEIVSEIHVLTSTELPQLDKEFLNQLANEYTSIKIFYLSPDKVDLAVGDKQYATNLRDGDVVASIRIDDDDALSIGYLDMLSQWMDSAQINEFVLSFPWGYGVSFDDNLKPLAVDEYKARLIAAGLAYIYTYGANNYHNIYNLGSHVKADDKVPVILDGSEYMFLRTFHSNNDSKNTLEKHVASSGKNFNMQSSLKPFRMKL